jgi:hypothetical protein
VEEQQMRPAPGPYRLTSSATSKAWDVDITPTGATGPFDETFLFGPGDGLVAVGPPPPRDLTLVWTDATHGTATFPGLGGQPQTVPFTCAPR